MSITCPFTGEINVQPVNNIQDVAHKDWDRSRGGFPSWPPQRLTLGKYSSNCCLLADGGSSGSGVGANSSFSSRSSSDSDLITWSGFTNSVMTLIILSTSYREGGGGGGGYRTHSHSNLA